MKPIAGMLSEQVELHMKLARWYQVQRITNWAALAGCAIGIAGSAYDNRPLLIGGFASVVIAHGLGLLGIARTRRLNAQLLKAIDPEYPYE